MKCNKCGVEVHGSMQGQSFGFVYNKDGSNTCTNCLTPEPPHKTGIVCAACGEMIKGATFWNQKTEVPGPYCQPCFDSNLHKDFERKLKPPPKRLPSLDKYLAGAAGRE